MDKNLIAEMTLEELEGLLKSQIQLYFLSELRKRTDIIFRWDLIGW